MSARQNYQVTTEYGALSDVIMGTGDGYHRDPSQVQVENATHAATFGQAGHPTARDVQADFANFEAALTAAGVRVHLPRLAAESVQDQTCPRDIGFVIGDTFVVAGMRANSRLEEIDAIDHILDSWQGKRLHVPDGICLEGGDVIIDGDHLFVGAGQRSDVAALPFLETHFGKEYEIVPLPTAAPETGEDILHLDCTFQPLGLGHALIYPEGLAMIPDVLRQRFNWIEVSRDEATSLATNIFSIAPDHVIARTHPACTRVNSRLRKLGYVVTELAFDAVPSTGGSFRCATLPLRRT